MIGTKIWNILKLLVGFIITIETKIWNMLKLLVSFKKCLKPKFKIY